jgi:flagellar motor switch protein FliM
VMTQVLPPSSKLVYPFDFQLPHQLPRASQEALQNLLVAWARLMGSTLTPRLLLPTAVQLERMDQQTFDEVLQGWTAPTVFVPVTGTLPGVVACDLGIARLMTYRLMGGDEWSEDEAVATTPLSDFEQQLWAQEVVQVFHEGLRSLWAPVSMLDQHWESVYFEPAFLSSRIQDADWVLTAHCTITIGGYTGRITWVWVLSDLAPLANAYAAHLHPQAQGGHRATAPPAGWPERVRQLPVPVRVELGRVPLRLQDLMALQVGQTFVLRTRVTALLPLLIADTPKADIAPCAIDGHYAAHIATVRDGLDAPPVPESAAESGLDPASPALEVFAHGA